jgi:hypothetical protein
VRAGKGDCGGRGARLRSEQGAVGLDVARLGTLPIGPQLARLIRPLLLLLVVLMLVLLLHLFLLDLLQCGLDAPGSR